jgi:hypothetical protein
MKHGGWLLAFVTAGALVRIVLLRAPEVWFDETTTGLMGLAVLRGDFPLYFFGQPFMGALDAYLLVMRCATASCETAGSLVVWRSPAFARCPLSADHAAAVTASPSPRMFEVGPSLSAGASSGWRKQCTSPRCS